MINRILRQPESSFLLLGPRQTGKSTLLRQWFGDALWFDLLDQRTALSIARDPGYFADAVQAQPPDRWIVVDEVQRAPQLMDEVHRLIELRGYRFALSGSSARKLKRGGANLLAGRALVYHLFPLTAGELPPEVTLTQVLRSGTLPPVALERSDEIRCERLRAYVGTYLAEEIRAEALTRNVPGFARFLTVAGLANAQLTNLSNLARDSAVARTTIQTYFSILEDTMIGTMLPAWTPRVRVREVAHPKFYMFDCGVLRAITDRLGIEPSDEERGVLLETFIFNELRAAMHYRRASGTLSYWRTHDGAEIDFVWTRGEKIVAVEVKASRTWKLEHDRGFRLFREAMGAREVRCYGVYLGDMELMRNDVPILPAARFLADLHAGKII